MMLHDMAMQRGSRYIQARAQEAEEEARRKMELKLAADEYRRKKAEAESGGWVEVKRESNATPSRECRGPAGTRTEGKGRGKGPHEHQGPARARWEGRVEITCSPGACGDEEGGQSTCLLLGSPL